MEAPRKIPEDMKNAFTLNNKIPVYDQYINEVVPTDSISWSNTYLENFINTLTVENIKNNKNIREPYFNGCKFHLYAFEKYIDNIKNKKQLLLVLKRLGLNLYQ